MFKANSSKRSSPVSSKTPLPHNSVLLSLNPVLDEYGLLRVGARLNQSHLDNKDKNPIIIPGSHHIASLFVRHHYTLVQHQGRHLTEGAWRTAGYLVIGGNRLISSLIFKCLKCRKLHGRYEIQKMADLPSDRLKPGPPFSAVGMDTFDHGLLSPVTQGQVLQRVRDGLCSSPVLLPEPYILK